MAVYVKASAASTRLVVNPPQGVAVSRWTHSMVWRQLPDLWRQRSLTHDSTNDTAWHYPYIYLNNDSLCWKPFLIMIRTRFKFIVTWSPRPVVCELNLSLFWSAIDVCLTRRCESILLITRFIISRHQLTPQRPSSQNRVHFVAALLTFIVICSIIIQYIPQQHPHANSPWTDTSAVSRMS